MSADILARHPVVSRSDWLAARRALLIKEKELTRQRDELSRQRRELPWVKVEQPYRFHGPGGVETLSDLFAGRSQLITYHFMFAPEWPAGCPHCSFWADNFNPIIVHLNHRDVTMVAVSRAPLEAIEAYRKRMGWTFKWVSSGDSSFNFDFDVSFTPEQRKEKRTRYNLSSEDPGTSDREGVSVFCRDSSGAVFHSYSTHSRGIDLLNTAYNYLDLAPKGRGEDGRGQFWVRRHDEYRD
jgi:predicted dithiol-disulfide oxidoreductase (DUF899 family)